MVKKVNRWLTHIKETMAGMPKGTPLRKVIAKAKLSYKKAAGPASTHPTKHKSRKRRCSTKKRHKRKHTAKRRRKRSSKTNKR